MAASRPPIPSEGFGEKTAPTRVFAAQLPTSSSISTALPSVAFVGGSTEGSVSATAGGALLPQRKVGGVAAAPLISASAGAKASSKEAAGSTERGAACNIARTAVAAADQAVDGVSRAAQAHASTVVADSEGKVAAGAVLGVNDHFSDSLPHEMTTASSYEKIGAPIGEGTYGTVWKAKCRKTNQTVAMKRVVLRNEREGFPVTAIREVWALRRLEHPNVVSVFDVCAAPPCPGSSKVGDAYIVFEYAPSDLTGLIAYRKQKLKLPEVKCIVKQLANALDFCHYKNIMHRDLKPSNVLITLKGELKLCDFGLSRHFVGAGNYSTRVITLWYRPPELLLGARHYDQSVDVWSAGCIIGELLAGYPLFPDSAEAGVFRKICERCGALDEKAWPAAVRGLPQWEKYFVAQMGIANRKVEDANVSQGAGGSCDIFTDILLKYGPSAADLLRSTLSLQMSNRLSSQDLVAHPFLSEEPFPCLPSEIKVNQHLACHELTVKRHREKLKEEKEAQRQQQLKRPHAALGAVSTAGAGTVGQQVGQQAAR